MMVKCQNLANAIFFFQDGEAQDAREAADERVHGVGAGGAEAARRPVPLPPQRRAQQDPREAVAVSAQFDLMKR